jgi:high-affinity iron transporter
VSGITLFFLAGEAAEEAGEVFEILVVFGAVFLLTYMILWMRKNGNEAQARLVRKTGEAARAASPWALGALAFAAVGREGLETVLFLLAGASPAGGTSLVAGGLIGLALAIGVGVIFYRGSLRINLKTLFQVTGVLLIVFAAGFLSHSLGELGETGLWPSFFGSAWDSSGFLNDKTGLGSALKSLIGYDASPSIAQIAGYWSYLGVMLWLFLRPIRVVNPVQQTSKNAV